MGILLLVLSLIFEVGFLSYCIITKQEHRKLKQSIRVAIFVVFVVLTLLSVIVWSFRWVMLGFLLFILALKGTVTLIRNKPNSSKFKTTTRLWKTMFIMFAFVFALLPSIIFPQHRSPIVTGEHRVATATYTYIDHNRMEDFSDDAKNRFVNVEFWYPEDGDGNYPLAVFSHGATGIRSSNSSTFTELASHGYVVVSIDHTYHSFYTKSEDGTITLISKDYNNEFNKSNQSGQYTKEELYGFIQKWMKLRTDDMNFVIDTILDNAGKDNDPVYQYIDKEKIAVLGHSMGGAASVWLSRNRNDIDAVINIDAPFFSELRYNKELDEYVANNQDFNTPLLNIYSDDVWKQLETNTVYVANKINNEHFKEAYTTHIQGAKHLSFTDLPLFSPILANMLQQGEADIDKYYAIETVNTLILQFLDYELKGFGQFTPEATY